MIANFPNSVRFLRILKNAKIGYTLVFAADDSYLLEGLQLFFFLARAHFHPHFARLLSRVALSQFCLGALIAPTHSFL